MRGGWRGGAVLDIMHDRSRITMDPQGCCHAGTDNIGFFAWLHQGRSAVSWLASRMNRDFHSTTNGV